MAVPTLKVEIAFDKGVYDVCNTGTPTTVNGFPVDGDWTDISSYVRSANVRRGRSDDFSEFPAGTASIVLDNISRKFDPFNSSSPFNGKLTPRKQIRITGVIGGVTKPIFRGYVNGFPVSWTNSGHDSTITVQCFDIIGLVNTANIRNDFADIYTRSLSPQHYWKCSDASGSSTITDYGSQLRNLSSGSSKFTSFMPLALGLHGSSADTLGAPYVYTSSTASTTGNITVSFWARWNSETNTEQVILIGANVSSDYLAISGNISNSPYKGIMVETQHGATSQQAWTQTTINPTNTVPKHYAITYNNSSGVVGVYINGVAQSMSSTGAVAGVVLFPINQFSLQNVIAQEIAVFNTVLTATEIQNIYNYSQGFKVDDTATRIEFVRSISDIPLSFTSFYSTAQSSGEIAGIPEPNATVLEAMKDTQNTEGGYLFVTKSGLLKATQREYPSNNANSLTSQAAFSDQVGDLGYISSMEYWYDGDNIRNDISVTWGGGNTNSASDATSISTYGRHTHSVSAQSSTQLGASDLANYWLAYYKQVVPSLSPIQVGTNTQSDSDWSTLLGLELLERISFSNSPSTGSSIQTNLLINSIELNMQPKVWSMKIGGSSRFTYLAPSTNSLSVAYNQDSATMSAYVNANGNPTTVSFEIDTSPSFPAPTTVSSTPSSLTGTTSTLCTAYKGSLSNNTTYYYRVKATNSIGTVYSSGSFTTYILKNVRFTSSGTWTMPSLGTGGITPTTAYYGIAIGGGGGGAQGGGGGATYVQQLTITLASSMVGTVGAGGAGGSAGGNATLTNMSGIGYGGGAPYGDFLGPVTGGTSGSGNLGGTGFYSFFEGVYGGGGGGGAGGVGGNYRTVSGYPAGGHGGAASTTNYYTYSYGGGGGGEGTSGNGTNGGGTYGAGGAGSSAAGGNGFVQFLYYGPAGSRSGTGWTEVNY